VQKNLQNQEDIYVHDKPWCQGNDPVLRIKCRYVAKLLNGHFYNVYFCLVKYM